MKGEYLRAMVYKADYIICPWCTYKDEDYCDYPWGIGFEKDEDEITMECPECGREFVVTLHVEYYFSSYKKEDNSGDIEDAEG